MLSTFKLFMKDRKKEKTRIFLVANQKTAISKNLSIHLSFLLQLLFQFINMSYLTDSYIVFTLKMESVSKNTIFGLKIMVKSGLEKFTC